MSRISIRARRTGVRFFLLQALTVSITVFSLYPIQTCAGGEVEPLSVSMRGRTPDFPTVSQSVLDHSHRGSSSEKGACYCVPVYHVHSGNDTEGGDCYSPVYHEHTSDCYTEDSCYVTLEDYRLSGVTSMTCEIHGDTSGYIYTLTGTHTKCTTGLKSESSKPFCVKCGRTPVSYRHTYDRLDCTRTSSDIDRYELSCGRTEGETVDSYDLDCPLEEKEYGSITLTNLTPDWTSGTVRLEGALNDPEGVISADGFGSLDFDAPSGKIESRSGNSVTVSENGTYVMKASVNEDRFDSGDAEVMFTVSNIDHTAPAISSVDYDTSDYWSTSNTLTVHAEDLQPDGTPGSGLADEAYSFDGGRSWQVSPSWKCTKCGTYTVKVRDFCGNVSEQAITITNVDSEGPSVTCSANPERWYDTSVPRTFTFTASDSLCGLADEAYSYDDGNSWTALNVTVCTEPGDFNAMVRDRLGNVTTIKVYNRKSSKKKDSSGSGSSDSGSGDSEGSDDTSDDGDNTDDDDEGSTSASDGTSSESGSSGTGNGPDSSGSASGGSSGTSDSGRSGSKGGSSSESASSGKGTGRSEASGDAADGDIQDGDASGSSGSSSSGYDINTWPYMPLLSDAATFSPEEAAEEIRTGVQAETSESTSVPEDTAASSGILHGLINGTGIRRSFYRSVPFKAAACTGGGVVGLELLLLIPLLLYSGIRVYSYDGSKYRLIGILPVRRSARGYHIRFGDRFITRSFSGKYKLVMGNIFIRKHKNELLYVKYRDQWIPTEIGRTAYIRIKDEDTAHAGR